MMERAWQGMEPDIVKLLVIENIMLHPSPDVYTFCHCPLEYINWVEKQN